jgi:hypothetical protein
MAWFLSRPRIADFLQQGHHRHIGCINLPQREQREQRLRFIAFAVVMTELVFFAFDKLGILKHEIVVEPYRVAANAT